MLRATAAEVVGRVDDDLVHARLLGEDLRLPRVRLEPVAVRGAAGEVDEPDLGAKRQLLRDVVAGVVGDERDDVGIEARLGQHLARDPHQQCERQDRGRMRLHHDGVAGREVGEEAGKAVPRRERAAADHESDAAGNDPEVLLHPDRLVLALRLLPPRRGRNLLHLGPRVRDRFESAVLRVRPARLERHHERLSGRVHHGVGEEEALLVDPVQDLHGDADPGVRSRLAPFALRRADRREQRVDVRLRIGDAQRDAERRHLAADRADGARLLERERLAEERVERGLAGLDRTLAVALGALGMGTPVAALGDRGLRALEGGGVTFE